MRKHKINSNDATTLKFELLYKIIIKIIENNIVMRKISINSDLTTQRVTNNNISNLINIVNKK